MDSDRLDRKAEGTPSCWRRVVAGLVLSTLHAAAPEPYHVRLDFKGANKEPVLYFDEADLAAKIARVICEYFDDPGNTM